jgi:hypothetical protein
MTQTRSRQVGNVNYHEIELGKLMPRVDTTPKTNAQRHQTFSGGETIYHVTAGAQVMYPIDAKHAVDAFPAEWSRTPWRAA